MDDPTVDAGCRGPQDVKEEPGKKGSAGSSDRLLKRKQANRDSARRSKQKKKQEVADLSTRKEQLNDTNQALIDKVNAALARVHQLQSMNMGLRQRYQCLLQAGAD